MIRSQLIAFGCLLWLAPIAAAQTRTITVQNLAPLAREEWVTLSVPFERGAVETVPQLHVKDAPTVWHPFGARWPDGSVRQALCMFRRKLAPLSEESLPLVAGSGPDVPESTFGLGPHKISFTIKQNGKTTKAEPRPVALLESNAARQVVLLRCRIGQTGLVGEVVLEVYAGQAHAYCGVSVFFSDPTTDAMECSVDEIAIETEQLALFLRHAGALGSTAKTTPTGSRVVILENSTLGDGQGLRRAGVLVPPITGDADYDATLNASVICKPLAATSWRGTDAFGAFGFVPEVPQWLRGTQTRRAFAQRHRRFVGSFSGDGDPFRVGKHQLTKTPGRTGDQPDFGIVQLEPVAATSIPSFLYEVELSVLQEGCRPVHYFETDCRPVIAANHPNWCVWEGRTHWNAGVSPDRLGKPKAPPKFQTHGWKGKIRSHWSANYLAAYYLLTGCPIALLEIRNEIRLFLAAQTIDPKFSTSGTGASRAVGRTLHTASWLYLCTGDHALRQRMIDRVHKIAMPTWFGRERPDDTLRPFRVEPPINNAFDGNTQYWAAWMDTLAVIGPAAVFCVTGDRPAKLLADGLALNTLRHAWRVDPKGTVRVVYSMRWVDDGRPLTSSEEWDPNFVHLSRSVAVWGVPSLEWAKQAASEQGLEDLVERADDLLRRLRARRKPPADGWFDRFGQWDAIRAKL